MQSDTKLWNLAVKAKEFYDARNVKIDATNYEAVRQYLGSMEKAQKNLDDAVCDVFKLAKENM